MALRALILVLFYILVIIGVIPVFLICAIFGWRDGLLAVGKRVVRVSRFVIGLPVRVEGAEGLDRKTPVVYMANHASFLDGPLLVLATPGHIRVIPKKSLFRVPVVGLGMLFSGYVPVDRQGARRGRASIERAAALMRERKYSYLIFPEGTRTRDGKMQALRRGGFFLACLAGAPIIPVSIRGAYALMPRGRWVPRKGPLEVLFHPPISTAGVNPAAMKPLMEQVRAAVASGLNGGTHV